MSSFWSRFPQKYGNNIYAKYCCTSCYFRICKEIYCGDNATGSYTLDTLKTSDIENLKEYFNKEKNNLDFSFPGDKLKSLRNQKILKMKFENKYYPIQIVKSKEELNLHEKNPTINEDLYRDTYDC